MALDPEIISLLQKEFPHRTIPHDSNLFEDYQRDATEIDHMPDLVILPENAEEIAKAVKLSCKFRFPIIARGAGTGFSGGAVAIRGGVILSLERMNRILDVDPERRTALVEPGVITYDLDRAANKHGLFYPPDPASHKESTLGGNLAECAGGLRCLKYGVTKDYVLGIEYVDCKGDTHFAGSMNDAAEPCDVTSLMIGSEGTLGIVTKMHLRLLPMPEARRTFLYTFGEEVDAAEAVSAIRKTGIVPCVMEFMDGNALDSVVSYLNLADIPKSAAMLLVELDGTGDHVERDAKAIQSLVPQFSPVIARQTGDNDEREKLWELRRELSNAIKDNSEVKTSEDVCVPLTKFAELVSRIREIANHYDLRTASFGHAGDGNLHVCFIIPELSEGVVTRMEAAKADLLRATLDLGGTISGEHGIGFTKKDFLCEEVGEDVIELFGLVKKSFDPDNLINPGKII
jgi:glycolate oxidase